MKRKYFMSEAQRRLLTEKYDGRKETTDALMQYFPGIPRWCICKWACQLGIARQQEPRWTQEEEEYLRRNIHRSSLATIAKHLKRTKVSIRRKKERLEVGKMQEGYTRNGLAQGLGCDPKKVSRWLEKGWLKATRRKSEREEDRDIWYISDDAIRSFVRNHPEEIDLRHVDKLWFLDVLIGLGELGQMEQENNNNHA